MKAFFGVVINIYMFSMYLSVQKTWITVATTEDVKEKEKNNAFTLKPTIEYKAYFGIF